MANDNDLLDEIWESIARRAPASLMRIDRRRRNVVDGLIESDPVMQAAMQNARIAREDRRQLLSDPSDRQSVIPGQLRPGDAISYLRPLRRMNVGVVPGRFVVSRGRIQAVPEGDMHPNAAFSVTDYYSNAPRSVLAHRIHDLVSKRPNHRSALYTDQRPPQGSRHSAHQPKRARKKRASTKSTKRKPKRSSRL